MIFKNDRMAKVKTCYNLELLLECREKDNALDLWIPEDKLNRDTKIQYICSCGNLDRTIFRNIYKTGMKCSYCKNEIKQKLLSNNNFEKYGVKNVSQLESVKKKRKLKFLETLGVEFPSQSEEVKQKTRENNLEKYGFEYPHQTKEVQEKIQKSCKKYWMENYGVENATQVPKFFEKSQINSRKLKSYSFPSGKEVKIQGYENYALDLLLKSYTEDEIIVGAGLVPIILYEYEDKNKRYYTDIYIPKNNLMIEVKSDYTMEKELEKNLAKRKASIEQGYDFQFWIFDRKQNLQILNKDEEYIPRSK